jgi:hypothetical protein
MRDLREAAGMFMLRKGCIMGAKVDSGDVQDWITEFAANCLEIQATDAAKLITQMLEPSN